MGKDFSKEMTRDRLARALCEKTGAITVLKGAGTVVAAGGEKAYTNTTGNPGMATGGAGDVLTGIIVYLAATYSPSRRKLRTYNRGMNSVTTALL